MKKRIASAVIMALLATSAFADSIDDAEAKKRGIPVSQLMAEKELAKAKAKNAELEKQIADLQKKLADQKAGGTPSSSETPATPTTDTPAAALTVADVPPAGNLNFDGPRQSSPLYDDFVKRYLDGDWATLAADLTAKQKEITALPAGNVADLTYIKQVLAESRPAWWDGTRTGKVTQFKPRIFKRDFNASFKNNAGLGIASAPVVNGITVPMLVWPADAMEDPALIANMAPFHLTMQGDNGFTKRDVMSYDIWTVLGSSSLLVEVGDEKRKALPPDQARQYLNHQVLRQDVTAGYYGTPPARRAVCIRAVASLEPQMNGNPTWAGVRPLGAAILLELAGHPDQYTNIALDPKLFIPNIAPGGPTPEAIFSTGLVPMLLKARLTLNEDRHIRDIIRAIAEKNLDWKSDIATLPENLKWHFDMSQDASFGAERKAFFAAHLAK